MGNHFILKGSGAKQTEFIFKLQAPSHPFVVAGKSLSGQDSILRKIKPRDSTILVTPSSNLKSGDWVRIAQNDSHLVTSTWAHGTVGQLAQITSNSGGVLGLKSELRFGVALNSKPVLKRFSPIENVGLECFKIRVKSIPKVFG